MTLKLLLVGRYKSDFQLIRKAFEEEDTDLIVATSIGLALFLARKNKPNLIISQYELTDSDVLAFFCELKTEEELAKIPFILLNAKTMEKQKETATNKVLQQSILKNDILSLDLGEESLADSLSLRNKILAFISERD